MEIKKQSEKTVLITERLKIYPLSVDELKLLSIGREALNQKLNLNNAPMTFAPEIEKEHEEALNFWLQYTQEYPNEYEWFTNWDIIHLQDNCCIGGIGFGGSPDEEGEATIGYQIYNEYQNKGFMTEALKAVIDWAFRHKNCLMLTAETPKDNIASQRVLIKNYFIYFIEKPETYVWRRYQNPSFLEDNYTL